MTTDKPIPCEPCHGSGRQPVHPAGHPLHRVEYSGRICRACMDRGYTMVEVDKPRPPTTGYHYYVGEVDTWP